MRSFRHYIESCKNDPARRQAYFKENGWDHISTYENVDGTFSPFLCNDDVHGSSEYWLRFDSVKEVKAWADVYAPELHWFDSH